MGSSRARDMAMRKKREVLPTHGVVSQDDLWSGWQFRIFLVHILYRFFFCQIFAVLFVCFEIEYY